MVENHQDFLNPSIWEEIWQEKTNKKTMSIDKTISFWDHRAKNFTKNVLSDSGKVRINEVLSWLESQGVTLEESTILDLGSGPGAFTIPLAQKAKHVTALEPSTEMTSYLNEYLKEEGIQNVDIVEEPWETIDISEWHESFDLVFASMNPGISNWEMAKKAIQCAKKYCYISTFAGKREHNAIVDLWPMITGEPLPQRGLDIIYLVNLLHLNGYSYELNVWNEDNSRELPAQEAEKEILYLLNQYKLKVDSKVEEIVHNYVQRSLDGDFYTLTSTKRLGKVLVKK